LSTAKGDIERKNTVISRHEQSDRQAENWHLKYQIADMNYKRVLRELNELKGLDKNKNRGR
jgi:hypothetical protein